MDKYSRSGIRMSDIQFENEFLLKIKFNLNQKIKSYPDIYELKQLISEKIHENILSLYRPISHLVKNTQLFLSESLKKNSRILLEGAQGCLLDVDFGTYPYVTSSHPTSGGSSIGSGIPPNQIKNVIGITKAYTTRVGEGPFPTELKNEIGLKIQKVGNEFGSTTSRPRRCGWLDLVALRYACLINGVTELALTKIDVLNDFDEIKVCTEYSLNGGRIKHFESNPLLLKDVKPVYQTLKGWKRDISKFVSISDLNENLLVYKKFIEDYTGVKIKYLSIGSGRDETIIL